MILDPRTETDSGSFKITAITDIDNDNNDIDDKDNHCVFIKAFVAFFIKDVVVNDLNDFHNRLTATSKTWSKNHGIDENNCSNLQNFDGLTKRYFWLLNSADTRLRGRARRAGSRLVATWRQPGA